jgi:hypothetical protein
MFLVSCSSQSDSISIKRKTLNLIGLRYHFNGSAMVRDWDNLAK